MGLFCKFQWGESNWGDGHFIGVVRVLDRVCEKARLADVTHTLRHTSPAPQATSVSRS